MAKKADKTKEQPLAYRTDALPDRVDLRDWMYQPTLEPLPRTLCSCHRVPEVLDQGQEGACTGFALAGVINFLLHGRGDERRVSPRMLYEMARRYDQWPGEHYEGSSARGAMKGWLRHGVASRTLWPDSLHGASHLNRARTADALRTPGGAYFRVAHRQVRDVHAALAEVGAVYCTLMVHAGWHRPSGKAARVTDEHSGKGLELPVILRQGRAEGGHAVALVGYTAQGFIVQNSWNEGWGNGGFALLPYEDFMLHVTDVWVAQLGVPVNADVWLTQGDPNTLSGLHRAGAALPLATIRPYIVNIGNNGRLSDTGEYWTTEEDLHRLVSEHIPAARKRQGWARTRVMLYLHGGLNSEKEAAARASALFAKTLANGIYPVYVLWETGFMETVASFFADWFKSAELLSGRSILDFLSDGRDLLIERTLAGPLYRIWGEMKENARLASQAEAGAMTTLARVLAASTAKQPEWELHVVAHSAGSIFLAYLLPLLLKHKLPLASVQLMAPAVSVELFKSQVLPSVGKGCPAPVMYALNQEAELLDTVGSQMVYAKSLLYLVANACEERRGTPILGMDKCVQADAKLKKLFRPGANYLLSGQAGCTSTSHGGFDNDAPTMNSVLERILGQKPANPFTAHELKY